MRRLDPDYYLTTMLDAGDDVSDLSITVEKPLQVEQSGKLGKVEAALKECEYSLYM